MGLFNDTDDNSRRDEVVIDAPAEDDNSTETRLGQEVESSLIDDSDKDTGSEDSFGSSDVSLDDIHRQNETIIDLLEQLVDKKESSSSGSGSRNSNRVTSRTSRNSNRVTDRKDSSDDNSIGDGMNELL